MAELADAADSKSAGIHFPSRFDPEQRHHLFLSAPQPMRPVPRAVVQPAHLPSCVCLDVCRVLSQRPTLPERPADLVDSGTFHL